MTVAIFCLACPYHVLHVRQFVADFRSETGHVGQGGALARLASLGWATHWFRMMPAMATWPLTVAACGGIAVALVRRRRDDVLLLVWFAVWAAMVG